MNKQPSNNLNLCKPKKYQSSKVLNRNKLKDQHSGQVQDNANEQRKGNFE